MDNMEKAVKHGGRRAKERLEWARTRVICAECRRLIWPQNAEIRGQHFFHAGCADMGEIRQRLLALPRRVPTNSPAIRARETLRAQIDRARRLTV